MSIKDKSSYRAVEGSSTDRSWPEKGESLSNGDSIEGRLTEVKSDIGKHKSKVYVLEVGLEKVGVWGSTVLDTKMAGIAVGKMVGIEYLGTRPSKDGSSEYHDFWVGEGIDAVGDEQ